MMIEVIKQYLINPLEMVVCPIQQMFGDVLVQNGFPDKMTKAEKKQIIIILRTKKKNNIVTVLDLV